MSTTVTLVLTIDPTPDGKSYQMQDNQNKIISKAEHTRRKLAFNDASVILDLGDDCNIQSREKPMIMTDWLKDNGLYVLQRDLHHSESPHLTGNRQG